MLKKLIGQKCYLATIDESHAEEVAAWSNDLEMSLRTGDVSLAINLDKQKEYLGYMNSDNAYGFYIVDKSTDEAIGVARLMRIDFVLGTAVLGMFIGKQKNRAKGMGTDAAHLIIDYAFNVLNLRNIMVEIASFNEASLALCRKCGFKEIGRRRKAIRFGNKLFDEVYMDILREEFHGSQIEETLEKILDNKRS